MAAKTELDVTEYVQRIVQAFHAEAAVVELHADRPHDLRLLSDASPA